MPALHASTQYDDHAGTAAVTWNSDFKMAAFAETMGVPENEIPIGIRILRNFGINRSDPIEDERIGASLVVNVMTIDRSAIGDGNVPDYFESAGSDGVKIKSHRKEFESLDSIFNWFKEIDIVLLTPRLAERDDLDNFSYEG